MKRLYDGYLADGKLEMLRGNRTLLESSTDHDSHNDSGYSTRLCTSSQGPSPALSGNYFIIHFIFFLFNILFFVKKHEIFFYFCKLF